MSILVKVYTAGAFAQHPLLIWDDKSLECFILDPGAYDANLESDISKLQLKVKSIINTHAHLDHIGAVQYFKNKYDVKLFMHKNEQYVLDYANASAKMFGLPEVDVPVIDVDISDGDVFFLGENEFKVIETPGHTPGGVCFYTKGHVFVGDSLFAGSIGRTDLPGGNQGQLLDSLRKLIDLPDDTIVYSGHGPETTIGREKESNPYLIPLMN